MFEIIIIEIVAAIATLGLVASNLFLVYVIYRVKVLEKARDIYEYKDAIAPMPKPMPSDDPVEVEIY